MGINTENCGVARAVPRADYYYTPQFSADGTKLAWLEWDHPNLFSGAKLFSADWNSGGYATNATIVAGENNEGVAEPRYESDGSLSTARRLIAIVSFIGSPRIRARPFGWSWRLYLAPKLVSVCFPGWTMSPKNSLPCLAFRWDSSHPPLNVRRMVVSAQ